MRTLIAIPCMDTVQTMFFISMMGLCKPEGTKTAIVSHSLIYDARNELAALAVEKGYDRVLWLDSDMVFDADLMERLGADLDEGREMVCGLYFTRRAPVRPCVYSELCCRESDGHVIPVVKSYENYPKDTVFEAQGCGFAACMMTTDLIRRIQARHDRPFSPAEGFGEDLTFCLRAREAGAAIWCDSRIKVGHAGISVVNEDTWTDYLRMGGELP